MPRPDFNSPRLFVRDALATGATVTLDRDQANYLLNVLRLKPGARVLVFNGRDGEWGAAVGPHEKRAASLGVLEQTRPQTPASGLTYAFAPLKHARLDYMVQKAVEMGVATLQPVLTRRTQVARINQDRMRANAVEAAEQCGVLVVPAVEPELRFEAWLQSWPADAAVIFCDEAAETTDPIAALGMVTVSRLALVIGPEGGFDATERGLLLGRPGVVRLSLGPRIMRADTAAVAALAVIQAVIGDWR